MHHLKSLRTRLAAYAFVISILLTAALLAPRLPATRMAEVAVADAARSAAPAAAPTLRSPEDIASSLKSAGLPVSEVTVRDVPNAKGTVVYIPQLHLSPGTSISDPTNDNAVTAQDQIQQVLSHLTKNEGAGLVMNEGDMYGPVASDTLAVVQKEVAARDALQGAVANMRTTCGTESTCVNAANDASHMAAQLDRAIALSGATHALKAEGATFTLYGAEDPTVQARSGDIVRDLVYLDDRITQLSGSNTLANSQQFTLGQSTVQQNAVPTTQTLPLITQNEQQANPLVQLLSTLGQRQPQTQQTGMLAHNFVQWAHGSGDKALGATGANLQKALLLADDAQNAYAASQQASATNLPSRSDNPYAQVSDLGALKSKLASVQNEMQNTIVDERNSVASQHLADAMSTTGNATSVLVYGAGHTEGLIKDLNARGLNVVIAVPQELGSDPELQAALAS